MGPAGPPRKEASPRGFSSPSWLSHPWCPSLARPDPPRPESIWMQWATQGTLRFRLPSFKILTPGIVFKLSRLRIQHCHYSGAGGCCGAGGCSSAGSICCLEIFACHGHSQKRGKNPDSTIYCVTLGNFIILSIP